MGLWVTFAAVVLLTSAWSYRARERLYRGRWVALEPPPLAVEKGAYRSTTLSVAGAATAPWTLRLAAFTCIVQGRAITLGLIAAALATMGLPLGELARPLAFVVAGYFIAGAGLGALVLMVASASVLRLGNDLLARHPRAGLGVALWILGLSLAFHALVFVNARSGGGLVVARGLDAATMLRWTRGYALGSLVHTALLLGLVTAWRRAFAVRKVPVEP
ncbi:MAG: hypothetical protein HY909_12155 [Deltaproteobacteria bacterium]|nr:hypothetical protein [Deltaproteobacteria bacterium]